MAERRLTAAMLTALDANKLHPAIFYEGEFAASGSPSTSFLRLWTGLGNYTWDSRLWVGAGDIMGISPIEETTELRAVGFSVSIKGLKDVNLSLALQSIKQGAAGYLYFGLFDDTGALILDPYCIRRGRCDEAPFTDDGQTVEIEIKYEDRLVDLTRPRIRRYTDLDQRVNYPEDRGFQDIEKLQDLSLKWGR